MDLIYETAAEQIDFTTFVVKERLFSGIKLVFYEDQMKIYLRTEAST